MERTVPSTSFFLLESFAAVLDNTVAPAGEGAQKAAAVAPNENPSLVEGRASAAVSPSRTVTADVCTNAGQKIEMYQQLARTMWSS